MNNAFSFVAIDFETMTPAHTSACSIGLVELGKLLQSLGADINTSITKKTNIVIIGNGAGPSKLKKTQELKDSGYNIKLIYEPELIDVLQSVNQYNSNL